MCVVQATRPTLIFYPLPLTFFLQILKLAENSSSAIPFQLQNLEKKYISKCTQSLVLEVNGLKKVISSKIDPFISVLSYLKHFQAGLSIPRN